MLKTRLVKFSNNIKGWFNFHEFKNLKNVNQNVKWSLVKFEMYRKQIKVDPEKGFEMGLLFETLFSCNLNRSKFTQLKFVCLFN